MSTFKNIIVIGGSGNVGREILSALIEQKDEFGTISALKREGVPASDILKKLQARGVRILEANFKDKASLVAAFKGIFVHFLSSIQAPMLSSLRSMSLHSRTSISFSMLQSKQRMSVRKQSANNRVKRFFPSEFGSNTNLPDVGNIKYLQPKIKFARHIEEKAKQGLIEYTFVNTGLPFAMPILTLQGGWQSTP
jgi:hypothetical protein